ncbi:hypothetical protein RJ55_01725 [Drechmeria coniospora]|nr:hypothetical protein RJ55_01725 [Drechmeria coniospora]
MEREHPRPLSPDALRELREELTIQQVILTSLQDVAAEGAEQERDEIASEISRLKALLRPTKTPQPLSGDENSNDLGQPPPSRSKSQSEPSSQSPSPSPSPSRSPTRTAQHPDPDPDPVTSPTHPTTPRCTVMDDESRSSARSQKRSFASTSLPLGPDRFASKRRTPTPSAMMGHRPHGSPSSLGTLDIIDLTGDDVDADAICIAEQIRQENRHRQEASDRELALRLSQEAPVDVFNEPLPTLLPTSYSNPAMMQADVASRPPAVQTPGRHDGASWLVAQTQNPPSPAYNLPGSYPAAGQPRTVASSPATAQHFGPYPMTPRPTSNPLHAGYLHTVPGHNSASVPPPLSAPPAPQFVLDSQASSYADGYGASSSSPAFRMASTLPTSGGGLLDIINSTSMFDYSNYTDQSGNALPERLTSYLQTAFHDPRVTEKELDDLLQNIRPDMDIPERNRDGTPAGLKSSLYHHQELALSWLKSMETGTNKGGILADDMGLGKTISMLALMLARPARGRPKTNLIVGPLSLLRQWEEEIKCRTKLSHRLSVFIYHGKKATTDELLRYDVVLTTYGTIAQEWKRLDKFVEENADRNIDFNDAATLSKFPLLHPTKATFYRVILDEAQCIKNKDTKTAKGCHKLRATYRWCLTGTPMMNGVLELFSLVHFLRIRPYSAWERFRQAFGVLFGRQGDPKSVAMSRLRALLKAIMLRRKKDSQLNGEPILKLPPKTERVIYAELTPDELSYYKQLESKSQVQFSKYLRDGSVGKNYSSILVLLLRLRQACCHPHMNLDVEETHAVNGQEVVELVKTLDGAVVQRIKAMEAFECPICFDAVQAPSFFIPCGHDSCTDCLARLVETVSMANSRSDDRAEKPKCPVCRGGFDPDKCFTYETFRTVHMPETIVKQDRGATPERDSDAGSDSGSGSEFASDDEDADKRGNLKGFVVYDPEDPSSTPPKKGKMAQSSSSKEMKKSREKEKTSEVKPHMLKSLRVEAAKNIHAYKKYMRYLRRTWMPAAKVTECMNLLKSIEASGEKTIIFSQWTLLLDLLQVAMWHDKFKHKPQRYDGSMSGEQRAKAALDFKARPDVTVMLVSLRAGNAGLNLTSANHVIIMDPFWNPYIEMQAVDRAYRIGQNREVNVYRILTRETVEDRIIALQERKKEIVEAALDETESMKIGRLNVNELKFLFNTRD